MNFEVLKALDRPTANGVLAAAALSSAPDPGVGERPVVLQKYGKEAAAVLSEIREQLNVSPENDSPETRARIAKVLTDALRQSILTSANQTEVLTRVGAAGQLSPVAYNVVQPNDFQATFFSLGLSRNYVEDAVKHPDDYQHLLTEGMPDDWKDISLFMKRVMSREERKRHWLLVQTHRMGLDQIAIAGWQIFPDDVNIERARRPIDVLKAFVDVFGVPITVGERTARFIESELYPIATTSRIDAKFQGDPKDRFMSISNAINSKGEMRIGVAYCVDLPKYRRALRVHGVKVIEPSGPRDTRVVTRTSHHTR
jgi:hypothetical protein